jgi:ADYC domain
MRVTRKFLVTTLAILSVSAAAVALVSGCSPSSPPRLSLEHGSNSHSSARPDPPRPWWAPCEHLNDRAHKDSCPTCSGNTAVINNFPIDGLHPGGCWNADNHRLVPGSLRKGLGSCPDEALSLDVNLEDEFLGRDSIGEVRCGGAALVGATFTVEAWVEIAGQWQTRTTNILITQARALPKGSPAPGNPPLYMLTPEHKPEASLCDASEARPWQDSWLTQATLTQDNDGPRPTPAVTAVWRPTARVEKPHLGRYTLPIRGIVFDENGNHRPKTDPKNAPPIQSIPKDVPEKISNKIQTERPGWFNIACAGGALAKMKIEALEQDSISHREATVKMLTARYCGDKGYTVLGPAIKIVKPTDPEPLGLFDRIEARWNKTGAVCLSSSRLWRPDNTVIPIMPKWKPICEGNHGPVPCTKDRFLEDLRTLCSHRLPPCDKERPPKEEGVMWTTYSVDDPDDP